MPTSKSTRVPLGGRYKNLARMVSQPKSASRSAGKVMTRLQQFKAAGRGGIRNR